MTSLLSHHIAAATKTMTPGHYMPPTMALLAALSTTLVSLPWVWIDVNLTEGMLVLVGCVDGNNSVTIGNGGRALLACSGSNVAIGDNDRAHQCGLAEN